MSIALPRVRDFRGVSTKSFDGRGNYSLGIKEQLIFPEIEYDKVDKVRGMDIIFVTTAKTDEEARELLKLLGMPFAIIKRRENSGRKQWLKRTKNQNIKLEIIIDVKYVEDHMQLHEKIWNMPYML